MNRFTLPVIFMLAAGFNLSHSNSLSDVVPTKLFPATVEISVKQKTEDSYSHAGTGWLYKDQTTVVTAKHVVDGFQSFETQDDGNIVEKQLPYAAIRITFSDGEEVVVTNVKLSKTYDLASLAFETKKTREPLQLAAKRPEVGTKLFGAGYPFEYGTCFLLIGNVTGYHSEVREPFAGEYLVTNAMFAPGNSGGPIVDEKGDVIRLVSWIDRRSAALSFALPVDVIEKALAE